MVVIQHESENRMLRMKQQKLLIQIIKSFLILCWNIQSQSVHRHLISSIEYPLVQIQFNHYSTYPFISVNFQSMKAMKMLLLWEYKTACLCIYYIPNLQLVSQPISQQLVSNVKCNSN